VTRPSLEERLIAAGVAPGTEPVAAWQLLRSAEGVHATVIDLYELVGRPRGLRGWQLPREERWALARSVMPLVWPGFVTTDGSERTSDTIAVVSYDESWPQRYERWREAVASSLVGVVERIEHVGSTSVPGLPAKPIIDVQVSVADLADEAGYVSRLERVGLQLRSRDDLHRYFRPFPDRARDVHVHVCATGSDWEQDHLLFRDYLRSHPDARDKYADVKWAAARRWSDDGIAYTDAKTEAVREIMARARRNLPAAPKV
jgi:GrpB-like predicted nucleotidyltransferase (UPF0157 family)